MIVCILSNVLLGVFSIDYLRKMSMYSETSLHDAVVPLTRIDELEKYQHDIDQLVLKPESEKEITSSLSKMTELTQALREIGFDGELEHMIKELQANIKDTEERINQYATLKDHERSEFYNNELLSKSNEIHQLLDEMTKFIVQHANVKHDAYTKDIQFGYKVLTTVTVVVVVLILFLSFIATNAVNKPTTELKKLMKQAEQGNFTGVAQYKSRDELGELMTSYNRMVTEVKELLKLVGRSSSGVEEAANQLHGASELTTKSTYRIAQDMEQISRATSISTAQLEENTASLQEVSQGVQMITERVSMVETVTEQSVNEAIEGTQIVHQTLLQMENIQASVQQSSEMIHSLAGRSLEIEQIIDVIHKIAGQTNLLALNAAIEAAHAGVHGRGFAIVADEVRKLAEQSMQSTKLITTVIQNIQEDTAKSVALMDKVQLSAEAGVTVTSQTAEKFDEIVQKISSIKPHIAEVALTIGQIASNTKDVSASAAEIAAFSQENAATAEHVLTSTQSQKKITVDVNEQIKQIGKLSKELTVAVNHFSI